MLLILMTIACSAGDKGDTGTVVVGDAASGAALYSATCAGCHGEDGMLGIDIGGTPSADLSVRVPAMEDDAIRDQIQNGGSAMPAQYSDPQDIEDVLAHLRATFP